jgi:phospholipid-binding lipoprotein MlaA
MRYTTLIKPALALFLVLVSACAEKPPANDPDAVADYNERNDPFEPANRKFFAVNNTLDKVLLHPAAVGYRAAVPETVRIHVHQTLSNINNPTQFVNDVLQGRPHKAGNTFMRLIINSTIGVGGVFDVATDWGFPDHDTDFGLTLAVWGIPGGPFLFLPVLGPSNPRDAVGYGGNSLLDPLTWASFGGSATLGWSRFGLGAVDARERNLDATDSINKTALDPYATYRSLSQQHRESAVQAADDDLPATVPNWYSSGPALRPAPAAKTPASPSPALAPPAAVAP